MEEIAASTSIPGFITTQAATKITKVSSHEDHEDHEAMRNEATKTLVTFVANVNVPS